MILLASLIVNIIIFKPLSAYAQANVEELKEIFNNSSSSEIDRVFVTFLINGKEKGQVLIFISPDDQISFQATPVLQQTVDILLEEVQQQLEAAVNPEGNLTLQSLREIGIEAEFDQRRLELQIEILPEKRQTAFIPLVGEGIPPEAEKALPPSDFSGWLNIRIAEDIRLSGRNTSIIGRQPINIDFDSALNYKGWVLENNFAFREDSPNPWQRNFTSLVRDDPQNALRYNLGDFSLSTRDFQGRDFQGGGEFGGIAVAKSFFLQPYQKTFPVGEYELFLENPATVEVFVNGGLTRILELEAGRHNIQNFNLSTGINDITLVIADDLDRTKIINFLVPFDFRLLAPGGQGFAYSFGFPANRITAERSYDLARPTLSLFHRAGLTNNLTLGGFFQGNPQQQLVGFEGLWATTLGNFEMETAFSNLNNIGSDYAVKLEYRYRNNYQNNPSDRDFNLSIEYRGENFTRLGELTASNGLAYEIAANYGQKIFEDINMNISVNYRFGRQEIVSDSGTIYFLLSKPLSKGLRVNSSLNQGFNINGQDDLGMTLNLSFIPPRSRQSVRTSINTITETQQINWFWSSPYLVNGVNRNVTLQNSPTGDNLDASLEYTHYRGKIDVSHNVDVDNRDGSIENISRLRLETAVVFADGHFAITRPVTDSFVLVVPHPNLEGQTIELNPFRGGFEARVDSFGPGVIPDLQSYRVSKVLVEALDLPLGYDLGSPSYTVLPTHKSGTLIQIGTDATVFIRGIIVDSQGEPVSLKVADVISLDDPDWQSVTLFTNRAGKFAGEGFKPGRYQVRFLGEEEAVLEFTIPTGQTGLYDVGTLQLPER
ncbi:MAG: fimbria/pilus outer membrane usher protein [Xenococcaceae cyanobacterium]